LRPLSKIPHCCLKKSLDRISVLVWLVILSNQLSIIGLVSHYLTNYLILYKPVYQHQLSFNYYSVFTIKSYAELINLFLYITHPYATQILICVRLACVRQKARIHSELESNPSATYIKFIFQIGIISTASNR
jgi:hypothetical protein